VILKGLSLDKHVTLKTIVANSLCSTQNIANMQQHGRITGYHMEASTTELANSYKKKTELANFTYNEL
jgi:hypothetical protein